MDIKDFTLVAADVSRRITAGESFNGELRAEWDTACIAHRDWVEANLLDSVDLCHALALSCSITNHKE